MSASRLHTPVAICKGYSRLAKQFYVGVAQHHSKGKAVVGGNSSARDLTQGLALKGNRRVGFINYCFILRILDRGRSVEARADQANYRHQEHHGSCQSYRPKDFFGMNKGLHGHNNTIAEILVPSIRGGDKLNCKRPRTGLARPLGNSGDAVVFGIIQTVIQSRPALARRLITACL